MVPLLTAARCARLLQPISPRQLPAHAAAACAAELPPVFPPCCQGLPSSPEIPLWRAPPRPRVAWLRLRTLRQTLPDR